MNRIAKVEEDYHEMMELKKKAEAADVAKSQVLDTSNIFYKDLFSNLNFTSCLCGSNHTLTFCSSLPLFLMRSELP